MREAHEIDMSTTATMMFGGSETAAERVEHLARIRDLQDESVAAGHVGFRAFIPWSFQPTNTDIQAEQVARGRSDLARERLGVPARCSQSRACS